MKRIYVAGASAELPRAKAAIDACRTGGLEVTHDWPLVVELDRSTGGSTDPSFLDKCARQDLDGIESADIFWLLLPEAESQGAVFEYGYAVSTDKWRTDKWGVPLVTVLSGPRVKSIFWTQADYRFANDEAALAHILAMTGVHQ